MANTSPVENVLTVPAAIALSKDSTTINAAKAAEMYGAIGTALADIQSNTKTLGGTIDTPETVLVRNLGQLETEHQSQKLAIEAGFSPDMQIDIRAIMLRDIRDTGVKMRDATARLQEQKSVSLFDDPLAAVVNAFVIPWTEQEISGYQEQQAAAKKTLDDITSGVTNSVTAQKQIQSSVTAASIDAQYSALQGMVNNQRSRISIESLQNNIHQIDFAMKADHTQLTYAIELNKWMNEERNYKILKAQKDIMLAEHKLRLQERTDRIAADKEFLGYVNVALTKNSLPTIASTDELNRRRQTAEGKRLFDDLYDKGRILSDPRYAATYTDGDTIEERVKFWRATGKQAKTPDEIEFARIVIDAYAKSQSKEAKINGVEVSVDKYFTAQFDAKYGIVEKDDLTNPNRAQTFTTMANRANLTSDQNFKRIFSAVIAPNITESNKNISAHPDLVGPMVVRAVIDGKLNPNDAAMFLADFYKASVNIASANSKVFEFTKRNFTNFNTEVEAGATIGKSLAGIGLLAGGIAAVGTGIAPIIGTAAALSGVGTGISNALATKATYDWTDPVSTQSYIIRKGFMGSTILTPGDTTPPKAKPTGAPLQ